MAEILTRREPRRAGSPLIWLLWSARTATLGSTILTAVLGQARYHGCGPVRVTAPPRRNCHLSQQLRDPKECAVTPDPTKQDERPPERRRTVPAAREAGQSRSVGQVGPDPAGRLRGRPRRAPHSAGRRLTVTWSAPRPVPRRTVGVRGEPVPGRRRLEGPSSRSWSSQRPVPVRRTPRVVSAGSVDPRRQHLARQSFPHRSFPPVRRVRFSGTTVPACAASPPLSFAGPRSAAAHARAAARTSAAARAPAVRPARSTSEPAC